MRKFLASYDETHIALKQRNNVFTPLVLVIFPFSLNVPFPLPIIWRIWLTEVQWEVSNSLSPPQLFVSQGGWPEEKKKARRIAIFFLGYLEGASAEDRDQ